MSKLCMAVLSATLCLPLLAQDSGQTNIQIEPMQNTPVYHVTVVSRTTEAVNYRQLSGKTKVDFRGTSLMPDARGTAEVEGKRGKINIVSNLEKLAKPGSFGPEYLTYVLWAITPEGRPQNLGELIPNDDGKATVTVTTELQAFGLIVTAEPYFAVTQPSEMVVAENLIRNSTEGWRMPITAKFQALQRGSYTVSIPASELPATRNTKKVPLELLEARNAVAIAKATGAGQFAPDSLAKAQEILDRAEKYLQQKQDEKPIASTARGAAQAAEDARLLTIRRREQQETAERQRQADERAREARERAEAEAKRAADAQAAAQTATEQRQAALQAQQQAEEARRQAEQAAEQARLERERAEAARQAAIEQQQQLAQQAQQAQLAAQQAQQERDQMRSRLQQQLNTVLQTRDSARGLIVNMSDVLFDFNKATLKPGARERLAKVAGIIMAYPDLRLQIEGFTDSIGSDQYNLELSQRRAATVRDYLISQGVPINNITAQGFGKSNPVASNSTAEGRQLNRRVDLVVSGEAIGRNTEPEPGTNANAGTFSGNAGANATRSGSTGTAGTTGTATGGQGNVSTPAGNASGSVATPAGTSGTTSAPPPTTPSTTPQQ